MKTEMELVSDAWREAAKDLGLRVEAPYELTDKSGKICRFAAYLPDFGSKNGALVLVIKPPDFEHDGLAAACAKEHGIWYSCLNVETCTQYDRQEFIDTLDDWQYFGSAETKPSWYKGTPWAEQQQRTKPPSVRRYRAAREG